jgi:hypothetical protein
MCSTRSRPRTREADSASSLSVPSPSWPRSFAPQHTTCPPAVRPHAKPAPTQTSTTPSVPRTPSSAWASKLSPAHAADVFSPPRRTRQAPESEIARSAAFVSASRARSMSRRSSSSASQSSPASSSSSASSSAAMSSPMPKQSRPAPARTAHAIESDAVRSTKSPVSWISGRSVGSSSSSSRGLSPQHDTRPSWMAQPPAYVSASVRGTRGWRGRCGHRRRGRRLGRNDLGLARRRRRSGWRLGRRRRRWRWWWRLASRASHRRDDPEPHERDLRSLREPLIHSTSDATTEGARPPPHRAASVPQRRDARIVPVGWWWGERP